MGLKLRTATMADLPQIEGLLRENDLPARGVAEHAARFRVADDTGRIVASAGLERYGAAALLRSVAVRPEYRNRGLAATLVRGLLELAARERIGEIVLFTTTAADYFRRFGFEPVARGAVRAEVRASSEFSDACCDTAQAMRLLIAERVARAGDRGAEGAMR